MRALKLKEFELHLVNMGCIPIPGKNSHKKWNKGTYVASVPSTHTEVSPGVIRNVCKTLNIPKPN